MIGFASDDEVQPSGHSTQSQLSKSRRSKRHKDEVKHHHSLSPVVRGCHKDEVSTQKRSLKCHLTDANQDQSGDDDDQYVCGGLESFNNYGIMLTSSGEEVTPHLWCHPGVCPAHSNIPNVPSALAPLPAFCECCHLPEDVVHTPILISTNQPPEWGKSSSSKTGFICFDVGVVYSLRYSIITHYSVII